MQIHLVKKAVPRTNSCWKMGLSNKYSQFRPFFIAHAGSGQYKSSSESFLFSLRNPNNMQPFKCPIINGKSSYAIHCHPSYGAIFGEGHDLVIYNNANTNQYRGTNLGFTYQPPTGFQYGTSQTLSLFAGSRNFTPNEIEVFY